MDELSQITEKIIKERYEWIDQQCLKILGWNNYEEIKKRHRNWFYKRLYKFKARELEIKYHNYDTGVEIWYKGEKKAELLPHKFIT